MDKFYPYRYGCYPVDLPARVGRRMGFSYAWLSTTGGSPASRPELSTVDSHSLNGCKLFLFFSIRSHLSWVEHWGRVLQGRRFAILQGILLFISFTYLCIWCNGNALYKDHWMTFNSRQWNLKEQSKNKSIRLEGQALRASGLILHRAYFAQNYLFRWMFWRIWLPRARRLVYTM